jgi:hypothetical protein
VIEFATTIAPGVRDVLLTGKVYEAANRNRRNKGARQYDAIVLDARPTGGSPSSSTSTTSWPAGQGRPDQVPGRHVMTLLRSPRTAIHLVTVLEEMPVQETGDGIAELRGAAARRRRDRQHGPPQDLDDEERRQLLEGTSTAGAGRQPGEGRASRPTTSWSTACSSEGRTTPSGAARGHQRALVEALGRPDLRAARPAGGVDLAGLYELAEAAARAGLG